MGVFISDQHDIGHEQVVFCQDTASGLRAIIAIYSTALGPSLGGTRFYPYQSEEAAVADALELSRAMAYKSALAGLDLGGGKAVIWGDPTRIKTETLLRAYGRFIESLGGRYYTACDVGTYPTDMDVIARETRYVTGQSVANGGCGDSSILTAWGVFQGMRAAVEHVWGSPSVAGKRIGVAGAGKVGKHLIGHLIDDGASVVVTDVNEAALEWLRATHPSVEIVADTAALVKSELDVYSPCALSGALDDETVAVLTASVVAGAANSQLAHPGIDKMLADRGILYTPDYVINAGGLIQVADEIAGYNYERARARVTRIYDTTKEILDLATRDGIPPATAADRLAERRMADVGRLRRIRLGRDH
jgi:valine dehydrogenase (NAD+)